MILCHYSIITNNLSAGAIKVYRINHKIKRVRAKKIGEKQHSHPKIIHSTQTVQTHIRSTEITHVHESV